MLTRGFKPTSESTAQPSYQPEKRVLSTQPWWRWAARLGQSKWGSGASNPTSFVWSSQSWFGLEEHEFIKAGNAASPHRAGVWFRLSWGDATVHPCLPCGCTCAHTWARGSFWFFLASMQIDLMTLYINSRRAGRFAIHVSHFPATWSGWATFPGCAYFFICKVGLVRVRPFILRAENKWISAKPWEQCLSHDKHHRESTI